MSSGPTRLGAVAHIIDPHPSHRAPPEVRDGVPFLGIGDIATNGTVMDGKGRTVSESILAEHANRYRVTGNTIGFGRVATIGKVIDFREVMGRVAISPTMAVVEPFKVDKDFLLAALNGDLVREQIDKWLTGSTRSSLGIELLREIQLPSFESGEEKKIGAIYRALRETIEKTEALIEKYQQIKAGLMHDLFTRGIGADGKLRPPREQAPELYQETPIGWVPVAWGTPEPFGGRVDVIDPNPSHRYPPEVQTGYPICSTENFVGEDSYDTADSKLVPESVFQEQKTRCGFREADVVFARKGKIGFARRYGDEKKVFSHTVVVMKPKTKSLNEDWLLWLARSRWFLYGIEVRMNTNSGVPTLGVEFIKGVVVPFPDEDEQADVAARLDAVAGKINALNTELKKQREIKAGLMHDLLSGAVSLSVGTAESANV